jgi:hypothetical protein
MPTLISTLSYRAKTQSFTHRKHFMTVDLQTIRIQFVDIFVTHPQNKVQISNNMTLWSHVCIILNYPACYHAKNKINNSLGSNVTLWRIYQFITSRDNKSQFCGAKLCNYNRHIKAITIKYHDRIYFGQYASRICVAPYYVQDRQRFLRPLWIWSTFVLNLVKGETVINARPSSCKMTVISVRL